MNAHAHHLTRDQVIELLEERDTLRETIRQYEELLCPAWPVPAHWGVRGIGLSLLRAIRSASPNVLHRERGIVALYGIIDDAPDQKILDVLICKLRRQLKLSGSGIEIETVWGRGWIMNAESAARFDADVAEERRRRGHAERETILRHNEAVTSYRSRIAPRPAEAARP